jgi:lipoprotein-anchoring transpeptidase ErfK/SrfK
MKPTPLKHSRRPGRRPAPLRTSRLPAQRRSPRREVAYRASERPGTIVVDPAARYGCLLLENGRAIRYGVGKQEAFNFRGEVTIARKSECRAGVPRLT